MLVLSACASDPVDSAAADTDAPLGEYAVDHTLSPSPATAGVDHTFALSVRGPDGAPLADIQPSHQRYVHTTFVGADLESVQLLHQESFAEVDEADLAAARFSFPVAFAAAGSVRVAYDFAHQDQYLQVLDSIEVGGAPTMAAPIEDDATTVTDRDVTGTLNWDIPPVAGFTAGFTVHLVDTTDAPIEDVVPWLGVDAYVIAVAWDLSRVDHAHAWVPEMEDAAPGAELPHLYPGPDLPVQIQFATSGRTKMWVMFARAEAPDVPYVLPFQFEVEG